MSNVVGNWQPYNAQKTGGGKPPDPAPIGAMPKAGYANPRFPTVGPTKVSPPKGGYKSIIDIDPPLDAGKARAIASVPTSFTSTRRTAGDQSRSAFARGLSDTTKTALSKATDTFNVDYQKQAEKSRAEDILAQRQNATDRFRMDVYNAIFGEDTKTRYIEGVKDGSQNYDTERRNEEAKRTAILLSFLGSLL